LTALAITLATHSVKGQERSSAVEKELDGTLEVQIEDSVGGARLRHFLKTPGGGRLELTFPGKPPELLTDSRVRVRGTEKSDGTLMLTSGNSIQTMSLASTNTFGVQQTLVILINFQNNLTQPYTVAAAQDVTFTSTSNYYLENTYRQTSLAGTVVGWYTIAASNTTCDNTTWAGLADQAAASHGVNLSAYPRRIYAFPQTGACSWWGLGSVGGNPSRAWINGSYALRVVGHELGHNFGDYHSHSMSCNETGCTISEYGDDRDIMGATSGHMNAFQKERLGWLNYGSSPSIQTVATTNNYWIEAMETATNGGPKALKILKSVDQYGSRTWYYVEMRARIGADGSVPAGVAIHTGDEHNANSSYEKDMQLTSTWDSVLDPSQSFTDPAIGLTITTITADSSGALVQVAFGAVLCIKAGPSVSVSPLTQSVQPGGTASYTVSVRNNDSAVCAAAPFNLSQTAPAGWTASFGAASLSSLAPGATGSASLSVTSPATASSPASISISAVESGSSLATSVGISVGIGGTSTNGGKSTSCTRAAPGVAVSPLSQSVVPGRTVSYTVSVTNRDTACAVAPFNLSAVVPTGWSSSFAPASLSSLGPGATASASLSVTSPSTASSPASISISAAESGSSVARSISISVGISTTPVKLK